jgi:hypothetical protein
MPLPLMLLVRGAAAISIRVAAARGTARTMAGSSKVRNAASKSKNSQTEKDKEALCKTRYKIAKAYAYEFKKYLFQFVADNVLNHPSKSPFTKMLQNKRSSTPLINTRLLLTKFLVVQPTSNGYKVGFILKGAMGEQGKTVRDILNILESGGNVHSKMENYDKVRAFIWAKVRENYTKEQIAAMRKAGKFVTNDPPLSIPARPFFTQAYMSFIASRATAGITFSLRNKTVFITVRC